MSFFTNRIAAAMLATALAGAPALAQEGEPIKVGVLHSLSGTMAISETTLKDTVLMLVAEQNAKGGLLGRPLEAVVVDPASDWPLFAEKARELLTVSSVDVIFGCWTSVSRKSVLPVIEELNGLLFYPVQYEGEESSKNVFYTGAAPNQQAIPAMDYFLEELGVAEVRAARHRLCLSAHDEQHSRGLPDLQGHPEGGHLRQLHPLRPFATGPRSWPTWWRWAPTARRSA